MKPSIAALALCAFLGGPVMAQPVQTPSAPAPAPTAVATTAAPVKPEDQIVCKRVDVSGTRVQLPRKCMTRKDWARMDGPGKEDIQSIIRSNLTRNSTGG